MKSKIYIVLPVFNRLRYTKRCLASVFSQTYKNFELILIDDGSTDGTGKYVQKRYPNTRIIKGDGNWWWTRSMYEGVKLALKTAKKEDFVLELNNDLHFEPNYFKELIKFAHKHPKALVGSICVKSQKPTYVVEAGIRIDWATGLVYGVAPTITTEISYFKNMESIGDLDALPGKGTLIPVKVFKKIGNFNYKLLPHYIADYEFSARAKKSGFDLLVDPRAIAKHFWNATGLSIKKSSGLMSLSKAYSFLLGRKSMNNIADWIIFVLLICPRKYLVRNFYFTLIRILKGILLIRKLQFLRPIFRTIPKLVDIFHKIKLFIYRLILKIMQFPKFHLK